MISPPSRISAGVIVLRRMEPVDGPALAAAVQASRDELERTLPFIVRAAADPVALIARLSDAFDRGEKWHFGVFTPEGLLIGGASLELVGRNRGRIGYWIHAAHQRRGHATVAARALARVALGKLGLAAVELVIARSNARSAAVPRRLGFRPLSDDTWTLARLDVARPRESGDAWPRLVAQARARFTLDRERPDGFDLVWEFATSDGIKRQKKVEVERVRRHGQSWLHITARVAPDATWASRPALARSAELASGGLAVVDGWLVVRAALPLAGTRVAALAQSIELVGYEAALLGIEHGAETGNPPAMDDMYL